METAFRSDERYTQGEFREWVVSQPKAEAHRYELIRGQIVMSPPAGWRHGGIEAELARRVGDFVARRALGHVFGSSTGYELPSGDTLEPDLSFVSFERWDAVAHPLPDGFLRVVPNLVVEISSPATARRDRTEKLSIYAENGVDEYWIIDPWVRGTAMYHRSGLELVASPPDPARRIDSRVLRGIEIVPATLFGVRGLP